MKQKLLFILFVAVILSVSCTGKKSEQRKAIEIPSEWVKLEKSDYAIKYPRDWELQQNVAGTEFCILSMPTSEKDIFRENVNLVVENLLENISLDKYAARCVRSLDGKYKILETKKLTADGIEHYCLKYGNGNDEMEQYVFIKGKRAYILTFSAERGESDMLKKTGEKIMQSFRIVL